MSMRGRVMLGVDCAQTLQQLPELSKTKQEMINSFEDIG
jgi:hypothetical protein